MASTTTDSVLDRVERVKASLLRGESPAGVQAVVDGPCPQCGSLDIVTVHAAIASFSCEQCGEKFTV